MELALFIEKLPAFNHLLANEIKALLLEKALSANLSDKSFIKAQKASKELRDHMYYATLNLKLFAEAIKYGDFKTLCTIVPSLFLDLHIQTEQLFKHKQIVATGDYLKTHRLSSLCTFSGLSLEQNEFINQFDNGMVLVRYPVWSLENNNSKMLQWIHFCLNCSKKIVDGENLDKEALHQLSELISFVFDAYKTARSLLQNDSEAFTSRLDLCKLELKNGLSCSKEALEWKSQKSGTDYSKDILKMREQLLLAGNQNQALQEAADHLFRVFITCQLKEQYPDPRLTPLHQRNALMMHWVLEQLFVSQGIEQGLGDLRWIPGHDLTLYYNFLHQDQSSEALKPFNFGHTIHYSREKQKKYSLPIIQNLLASLKLSKLNKINKETEKYWDTIFDQGIKLLMKEIYTETT